MQWEDKGEMIRLGNIMNQSAENKKEFHDFCIKHMQKFDWQAWDMFCNVIQIIPEEMKKDIEFWKEAWPYLKLVVNGGKFTPTGAIRIALLQDVCQNYFK